jgi:peptide/nickel transport system substrate-binding protein
MRRWTLMLLASLLLVSVTLAGCTDSQTASGPGEPKKEQKEEGTKAPAPNATTPSGGGGGGGGQPITELKQSTFFNDKSLPPVKDRLPVDYKITNEIPASQMKYEVGSYGGNLRTVTSVVDWDADVFVMNNEPLLNTPGILGDEITGNVLKDYKMSDDQKTFTFNMRKGMKWSDGKPVTTEDVRFAIEDVQLNKELTPIVPVWLRSGGEAGGTPLKLEVVDEYTFKLSFDKPYGGLLIRLAIQGWRGYNDLLKPSHFLKPFHTKYTKLADLEPKIKEAGFQPGEWVNLFNFKDVLNTKLTSSRAIGFPVLYPWIFVKKTDTTATYERNPYYFKVDNAGNQLPYIDKIQSTLVQDIEMVSLKTITGEVDFSRESAALIKMPLYKENEKNGYKALLANMHVTPTDFSLNLSYDDPAWQQVVQDVRFRKALNMALNRKEIIDSLYYGFAKPSKIEDPTYDTAQANKLLDEIGMKKGPDGFRLGLDGKKFTIPFEVGAQAPDIVPMTQLVAEMWKAVGINTTMKTIDQTLWTQRRDANEIKATMIWTHTPLWYMGDWGFSQWAPLWDRWRTTGGKEGKEPPADVKKLYSLIDQAAAASPTDSKKLIDQVKKEMADKVYYFIPIADVKQPLIVNAKLHNVPNSDDGFAISANFSGEQFFFGK